MAGSGVQSDKNKLISSPLLPMAGPGVQSDKKKSSPLLPMAVSGVQSDKNKLISSYNSCTRYLKHLKMRLG